MCVIIPVTAVAIWFVGMASTGLVQAELALGRGDIPNAFVIATRELVRHPTSNRALAVAGAASLALHDPFKAKSYFEQVTVLDPMLYGVCQRELGHIALNLGRAVEAEEHLRVSLQINPRDPDSTDQLIYLLMLEGRGWEARRLIFDRLRSGTINTNYLVAVSRLDNNLKTALQFAERCLSTMPDEPLPRLALAQQAWRDHQVEAAQKQVQQVLSKHPQLLDGLALQCQITVETGTPDECLDVFRQLPPTAVNHPLIWLSRGVWAEKQGQTEAAARCYWESLQLYPELPDANYRLSQVLVSLGNRDQALPFAQCAQKLTQLNIEMSSLSNKLDLTPLLPIVLQLEEVGRYWEAAGWCQMALQQAGPHPDWLRPALARLCRQLSSCETFTDPARAPSRQLDLSHFKLPDLDRKPDPGKAPSAVSSSPAKIAFRDDSTTSGPRFTYENGARPGDFESMAEMNGGGVAILDYDGDNWPDVYLTQGGSLPPAAFDPTRVDQLFRNRANTGTSDTSSRPDTSFISTTVNAKLFDVGYGQGVTVGDFDNDGFPDLYVGNIGPNQFYHNNGDGTFTDVTGTTRTQAEGWTSSSVLADFNQDGLPDLYVVGYLAGDMALQPCNKRIRPRCGPLNYPAEPDRFFLNLGDGTFRDATESHGLHSSAARGLGVVAADFDGTRRLGLFVANDMTANFFFRNRTTSAETILFEEEALLSGLAFDHTGQVKAGMGIAADDFNLDGRLDLYVTNFYRQSNDLYVQDSNGTFQDESREARLFETSFSLLGWGTQFVDGDLDGHPDLIVTNGHVHDPVDPTIPYYMPSQFFHNLRNGTFEELPVEQLGEFFERRLLGRALARLDWNRDGREDVVISHLNDPSALLTNQTVGAGNFLSIQLVAVNSARDAIGTRIRVESGSHIQTRQLTAGDGFHTSNERRLVFGLGSASTVKSFEIFWPSGQRQLLHNLAANSHLLVIEQETPFKLTLHVGQMNRRASNVPVVK